MKKTIFAFLSIGMIAVITASCTKTNTRKFSNDWKVTHEEYISTFLESGISNKTSTVLDETTITETFLVESDSSSETIIRSGTVQTNDFTIEKDGTWSRTLRYKISAESSTSDYTITSSGTWSFLGKSKSDDFRRNDRVVFYTLAENEDLVITNTTTGESQTENSKRTFQSGLRSVVYRIGESKKKELQLEMDGDCTATSGLFSPLYVQRITWSTHLTLQEK